MACYAIGDVQGCYDELARLLEAVRFDSSRDEVWFVGDLVNRGPRSLETLRLVRSLGDRCTVVLGNHDLHLLALAMGNPGRRKDKDLTEVLEAPDAGELVEWLRQRPLVHYRPELNTLMVHAGLPPQWDPLTTVKLAREVEHLLQSSRCREFMQVIYGDEPDHWNPRLAGFDRARFIVNALTRIRYVRPDGSMDLVRKGAPATAPSTLTPWFEFPARASATVRIVFGHWSTLGLIQGEKLLGLDTGCVWGGALTAVRLDGPARTWQVKSAGYRSADGDE